MNEDNKPQHKEFPHIRVTIAVCNPWGGAVTDQVFDVDPEEFEKLEEQINLNPTYDFVTFEDWMGHTINILKRSILGFTHIPVKVLHELERQQRAAQRSNVGQYVSVDPLSNEPKH
jgi:hypothetical protein